MTKKYESLLSLSSSKWHWYNHVKTHRHVCVRNQIFQLIRGGVDQCNVNYDRSFPWFESHQRQQILELHKIEKINLFTLGR